MAGYLFVFISVSLNLIFFVIIVFLLMEYFKKKKQIKELANELGNDSLEHYLSEIKKRGFDFTLKPKSKK